MSRSDDSDERAAAEFPTSSSRRRLRRAAAIALVVALTCCAYIAGGRIAQWQSPVEPQGIESRGEIMIANSKKKPGWVGKTISQIAKDEGREQVDVAVELLTEEPGTSGVNFGMDEADVRYVMTLPWVATASDGSAKVADDSRPHPRSFGTFSRKVGRYSIKENVLPLAAAIRSASGLPADIIGMQDRGYLKKDLVADIVVFDPKSFEDEATFDEPFKASTGVRWLFVNGKPAIADGQPKDLHAGKSLRKPLPK